MVTDQQVRRLFKLMQTEETLAVAAAKAGMDEKTARKYLKTGKLPSELKKKRTWRTRTDPFEDIWDEVRDNLAANPGFEAKTLFDDLQHRFPGKFSDWQLRTLQRRVKRWRSSGRPFTRNIFSPVAPPRRTGTVGLHPYGKAGNYHCQPAIRSSTLSFCVDLFQLETGSVCFSESFESLSEGLQAAFGNWAGCRMPIRQTG